jgi:glycosyltransferase involved in cell wall biosynthesis
MKLLVFAHTPPPHHGQSYLVKLMLDGFGGDVRKRQPSGTTDGDRIECYHVNTRYSEDMEDIGSFRFGKAWLVLRYCIEAIWCRFRFGVRAFYYVPAPGKRAALYRDWIVMAVCRPFFRHFIHHWHAAGLGDWLQQEGFAVERWITHRLLGYPSLGMGPGIPSLRDALWFRSRRVEIVEYGIPDPCPDFESEVLPYRRARLAERRLARDQASAPIATMRVLFLAHCIREKGIFDALDAVALANERLRADGARHRLTLTVAGLFLKAADKQEFHSRIARSDLEGSVEYLGFVGGEEKTALLKSHECLLFPTYYDPESFGLVIVEAMAAGMALVTTRWRAIPDILPSDYSGLVPVRDIQALAKALLRALDEDRAEELRAYFTARYTDKQYVHMLKHALRHVEPGAAGSR